MWFRSCCPPLRERIEDIPLLIDCFTRRYAGRSVAVSPSALKLLMNYDFPGNIRELENIIERSLVLSPDLIQDATLPPHLVVRAVSASVRDVHIPLKG
jgi:DNA-binding NtrC family response regulator